MAANACQWLGLAVTLFILSVVYLDALAHEEYDYDEEFERGQNLAEDQEEESVPTEQTLQELQSKVEASEQTKAAPARAALLSRHAPNDTAAAATAAVGQRHHGSDHGRQPADVQTPNSTLRSSDAPSQPPTNTPTPNHHSRLPSLDGLPNMRISLDGLSTGVVVGIVAGCGVLVYCASPKASTSSWIHKLRTDAQRESAREALERRSSIRHHTSRASTV